MFCTPDDTLCLKLRISLIVHDIKLRRKKMKLLISSKFDDIIHPLKVFERCRTNQHTVIVD